MSISPEDLEAVRERHTDIPQDPLPIDVTDYIDHDAGLLLTHEDADDLSTWEWPPAVHHCHYRGRLEPQHGRVLGPTLPIGDVGPQYLTVVEQSYDEDADRTTLGLTYGIVAPTEPGEAS